MVTLTDSLTAHLTRPRRPVEIAVDCLLFGMFVVGIAYLIAKAIQVSGHAGYDFKFIWLAGESWRRGINPYTAEYYSLGKQLVVSGHIPDLWVYPPNWYLPAVLIALAKLKSASVIWSFANIGMLLAASALLTAALPLQRFENAPRNLHFALARQYLEARWNVFFLHFWAIAVLEPTALTLSVGQTSILVYFGTSLLLYGLAKNHQLASVLGLSIVLLKPQIAAVICIALVMSQTHRMLLVKAAAVSVAMSLPAFILAPTAGFDFLANLSRYDYMWSASWPQSTTGFRHLLWTVSGLDPGNLVSMVVAILVMAGLAWTHIRLWPAADGVGPVTLAVAVTIAVAPLHFYDMVLAGILLFLLAQARALDMGIGCLGAALLWRADNVGKLTGFYDDGTLHFEGTRLATLGAVLMLIAVFQTARRAVPRARP
jgi:hypothetical protein